MPPEAAHAHQSLPVVLAPGLMCDDRLWAPVRGRLAAPSTVVDLRPCDNLEAMARALIQAAPGRALLAGFSMGGMAAILAGVLAPECFAGLVILDTHVETDTPERRRARLDQIGRAEAGFERLAQDLPSVYWPQPDPADAALVTDMALEQGRKVFVRHVHAILQRPDLAAWAARLRLPVRVVCGRDDRIAPPALAERMAGLIPGAGLAVLEDCGHMAPLDRPADVARIIGEMAGAGPP